MSFNQQLRLGPRGDKPEGKVNDPPLGLISKDEYLVFKLMEQVRYGDASSVSAKELLDFTHSPYAPGVTWHFELPMLIGLLDGLCSRQMVSKWLPPSAAAQEGLDRIYGHPLYSVTDTGWDVYSVAEGDFTIYSGTIEAIKKGLDQFPLRRTQINQSLEAAGFELRV